MANDTNRAEVLARLAATIEARKGADAGASYVASLLHKGRDAILIIVDQVGGIACHTGRERCFFQRLEDGAWRDAEPVLKDPKSIYGD